MLGTTVAVLAAGATTRFNANESNYFTRETLSSQFYSTQALGPPKLEACWSGRR